MIALKFNTKYYFSEYQGRKIFYLTPIREIDKRSKDGSKQWEFECICGKKIIETPYRVISGHVKSCGCMRYKRKHSKVKDKSNMQRVSIEDFIGKKSYNLTVIGLLRPEDGGRAKLHCLCNCGKETYLYPYQFSNGIVKSCGCARTGHTFESENYKKHGLSKNSFYKTWQNIKNRCYNKNADNYDRYGGRGIFVCDEWLEAENFIKWAINTKPKIGKYTIDRIDNDGPYAPWNCRWATDIEQARNKRSSVIIEYNNEKKCIMDWAKELGIAESTLRNRLAKGWSIERAFSTPVRKTKKHLAIQSNL